MSSMQWTRVTEQFVDFPVTATDASGNPVTITGVQCALLAYRSKGPDASTTWVDATWTPGVNGQPGTASVLVAGPDAPSPGATGLQMGSTGADLWALVVDNPERVPAFVVRLDLQND